jgi:hypothetical protein
LTCLQSLLITHGHGNAGPVTDLRFTNCNHLRGKDLWRKNSPWTRLGPCKVP